MVAQGLTNLGSLTALQPNPHVLCNSTPEKFIVKALQFVSDRTTETAARPTDVKLNLSRDTIFHLSREVPSLVSLT